MKRKRKRKFIFGLVILLLVGLLMTACQNNGRENENGSRISINTGNGQEETVGDFILTISAENAAVKKGKNFKVNVELKNNSEDDHYIAFSWLSSLYPPDWDANPNDPDPAVEPPDPQQMFIENNGTLRNIRVRNDGRVRSRFLALGKHEIRFFAYFYLFGKQGEVTTEGQMIEIFSNPIILTVR